MGEDAARPHDLGARIIQARKDKGLEQAELARRAGIGRSVLSRLETGDRTNPGMDLLKRIADALDVSIDYLAGRQC